MGESRPPERYGQELACGIDVVDIDAFSDVVRTRGAPFLRRVFTPTELLACRDRNDHLALRFAAKEAVVKALGRGTPWVRLRDIEVLEDASGQPHLNLRYTAGARARSLRLTSWRLSLSRSASVATAMVVGSARALPENMPFMRVLATARRAG